MHQQGSRLSAREPSSHPPRPRQWLRDTALIAGITLALAVLLEGGLRVLVPQHETWTRISGNQFSLEDELLGIRYSPGARVRVSHPEYRVEYAINPRGFRDEKDHPVPKPEGNTRVFLLGDSFAFGQGVEYADTWAVIAERRLQDQGQHGIDLVKAGVQGMDQRSEFILLRRLLPETQSDVVVVAFLINDLYTNVAYEPGSPGSEVAGEEAATSDSMGGASGQEWEDMRRRVFSPRDFLGSLHLLTLAKRIMLASDAMYSRFYISAPGRGEFLRVPLATEPLKKLQITEELFQKMAALTDSLGKRLIVLSIPQQFQVLYYERSKTDAEIDVVFYDRHFATEAERMGFTWVSTLDEFAAVQRTSSTPLFYRLDGHLTPAGNQVVADVFLREIAPLLQRATQPSTAPLVRSTP